MGDVVSGITGALGLSADTSAGAGAAGAAQGLEARAVAELEKLNIPDIEKQKILLQLPQLVDILQAETLDESAFEDLDIDPTLRENILGAIASEKEYADQGITEEDRARLDAIKRQTQADEQARQESIMQSMAERGAGGAGSELAARLSSNQAQADRAQQEALNLAAQASQNRRQATQNVANMSSQLDAQDFQKQAAKASAADEIARFNAMNRQNVAQQNLAQRQNIADQSTALQNQQQMYNKGLYQQQFQNEMAKATGITNQLQNQAQGFYNQANQQAQAAQAQAAGNRQLLGTGLSAFAAFSDEKTKENVTDLSSEEIQDMLNKLKGKKFDYKDEYGGKEDNAGVMAQDLEKSKLGSDMVFDTPAGKMVDKEKMLMTNTAALSDVNDRLSELEEVLGKLKYVKMPNQYQDGGFDMDTLRSAQGEYEQKLKDDAKFNKALAGLGQVLQQSGQEVGSPRMQQRARIQEDPMKYLQGRFAEGGSSDERLRDITERRKNLLTQIEANRGQGSVMDKHDLMKQLKAIESEMVRNVEAGKKFNNGGMESPASYTDGGERVDELVDMGELEVNPDAQQDLMEFLRGNKEAEEMEGRIIEGDSFSGDLLPDRINSGELVANLGQQHRVKDKLMDQEAKARGFNRLLDMLGKK